MKVKLLCDYVGRETAMKELRKGTVIETDHARGGELIRLKVAEEVTAAPKDKKVSNDTNT